MFKVLLFFLCVVNLFCYLSLDAEKLSSRSWSLDSPADELVINLSLLPLFFARPVVMTDVSVD